MSDPTRFDTLADAAERYGQLSLDNYAQVRSIAENIATGFCRFLGAGGDCVYLVPPSGNWSPQPHRSGAFSVSGSGFLPLEPISFGLAVRVSRSGDWVRLVLTCSKSGQDIDIAIQNGRTYALTIPVSDAEMHDLFEHLHGHLVDWFKERADRYEHGDYGGRDIGFDFIHSSADSAHDT